jgi:Flp pilus assembly pilin Flp
MLTHLKKSLAALHRDEAGAMKVEMILILILISLPLLVVLFLFRNKIIEYFQTSSDELKTNAGTPPAYNP